MGQCGGVGGWGTLTGEQRGFLLLCCVTDMPVYGRECQLAYIPWLYLIGCLGERFLLLRTSWAVLFEDCHILAGHSGFPTCRVGGTF